MMRIPSVTRWKNGVMRGMAGRGVVGEVTAHPAIPPTRSPLLDCLGARSERNCRMHTDSHARAPVDVVLFDLLTALLDSWSLWTACAGGAESGRLWRMRYLELTYGCGDYVDYEHLARQSALDTGLPVTAATALVERWGELEAWPEVPDVLAELQRMKIRLGVVTNCSERLGRRAATTLGHPVHLVTSERAGAYKPDARPYRLALAELGAAAEQTLFVAGSPSDIGGARAVGLRVAWHNRAGLVQRTDAPRPLVELASLHDLPDWVRPGARGGPPPGTPTP